MGGTIERRRVPFTNSSDDTVNRRGKGAFGLESAKSRSRFTAPLRRLRVPLRSALNSQDERTVPNGVLETSSRKWSSMPVPFIWKSTQRNSSWPGDLICLQSKAEYICADLSIAHSLFPCSRAADHTFFVHVAKFGLSVTGIVSVCRQYVLFWPQDYNSHQPGLI